MLTVRETVDPSHTLPSVELKPVRIQEWEGLTRIKMTIVAEGEEVGECDIVLETSSHNQVAHFDGIEINEKERGRGIGMAAYLLAIELSHGRGLPFETQDYDQTASSKRIWEALAEKGVAQVIEPFRPSQVREDRFIGKFRVPVPEV